MAGFWKGLGKTLLKAAPIAASFIPGMGPIASALVSAGTGAASGASGGGGWKGAISGGLSGAQEGYQRGKNKGIGPSEDPYKYRTPPYFPEDTKDRSIFDPGMSRPGGSKYDDGGLQSSLDDIIRVGGSNQRGGGIGPSKPFMGKVPERSLADALGGDKGFDWKKLLAGGITAGAGIYGAKKMYDAAQPKDVTKEYGPEEQYGQGTGRRLRRDWSTYEQGEDQRAPNLADAISQGRREAVRNQPWRDAEYDRTKRSSIYPSSSRRRKTEAAAY